MAAKLRQTAGAAAPKVIAGQPRHCNLTSRNRYHARGLHRRHALPGIMPAPMMVMKYPHRLGCINSGGVSHAWCR